MKRIMLLALAVLAFALPVRAQRDSRQEIMADIEKAGGTYYMYPTDQPVPTAAPKGYKPFYISHVGRHGARYVSGSNTYANQLDLWSKAHDKKWLTSEGEEIYKAFAVLSPQAARMESQLSRKGQEQHRLIARQMYRNYPAVFKGKTCAAAAATNVHRVIVSMYSCVGELARLDKDLSYDATYGYPNQATLLPDAIDKPVAWPDSVKLQRARFQASRIPVQDILSRWFTVPADSLGQDPMRFLITLHSVVSDLDNMDFPAPEGLRGIFRPEERYGFWESDNYRLYLLLGRSPQVDNDRCLSMQGLLDEIIGQAESDPSEGIALRLRFGHDSTLMPLLSLMDVNGMGAQVAAPEEVGRYWRSFDIPMACNLQLVLFKSKKSPDILVQVLLNGREATLPLPMAAPGSFYRWQDFKARYASVK